MTDLTELLRRWPSLPDDAVIPSKLTAAVTSLSERSIRYHPELKRVYLNKTRYGFRAGDVRKILAGAASEVGDWQSLGDAASRVVESCGADVRDHNIKMQCELRRREKRGQ